MFKAVNALNSFLSSLVSLGILAVLGVGGWIGYQTYFGREQAQRQLAEQKAEIENLNRELEARGEKIAVLNKEVLRLDTANRLLKVDHRVAYLDVLSAEPTGKKGETRTRFSFVEVDQQGKPLEEPRIFTVLGDMIHLDALVVKFDDKSIEENDPLRSTSLCLFQRIYGDKQKPEEGFVLDRVGAQPVAYRGGKEVSDLERQIWSEFWDYANNQEKAEKAGIRAAHGQGVFQKAVPGKRYRINLRSTGDLWIRPEDIPAKTSGAPL